MLQSELIIRGVPSDALSNPLHASTRQALTALSNLAVALILLLKLTES